MGRGVVVGLYRSWWPWRLWGGRENMRGMLDGFIIVVSDMGHALWESMVEAQSGVLA
jgi:hypothetical protein